MLYIISDESCAQTKKAGKNVGVGFEIGQWLPSSLYSNPDLALKEVPKKPYAGLILLKALKHDFFFRSSLGYWKYDEELNMSAEKCVRIIPVLFDLKYLLLTEVLVQPYVSYGAGMFFGSESKSKKEIYNFQTASEMGIGISLGTGFDFQLSENLTIELEFRYLYVKFNHYLVFTESYSGPKVNMAVLLLL